ncbi:MAG: hypothetical protein AAB481_03755 [Patescibacteria group bacterium]
MLPTDKDPQTPSAFDHSPETDAASQVILMSAAGYDASAEVRLDERSQAQWRGVAARILGVGPDHGKEILELLNPFALGEGISPMSATAAIEIYCRVHGLAVPEIPDNAKTISEGVFSGPR